jgi:hypothetical protein
MGEYPTGERWLWCLHCMRFFQARDLRKDFTGAREGCAFADCDGAGLGVDIYPWNDWYKQNKKEMAHWPKSTAVLTKGMKCCLYLEDQEKLRKAGAPNLAPPPGGGQI